MPPRGLGRGLESLIPTQNTTERVSESTVISLDKIRPSRYQPRQRFNEDSIKELAESIQSQGLIQPLVVMPIENPTGTEQYELIAGERRWRASKLAGLTSVPIVVKKVSEKEQFQIALIENIQREDLNPIDEAVAYKKLIEEFKLTQEELSKIIGKGRVVIANTLRLLNLPKSLQDAVSDGTISSGHARNLVSIGDENIQKEVAEKILKEHLTVRDIERIVSEWKGTAERSASKSTLTQKDPEIRQTEENLQQLLGTKVEIKGKGKGSEIKGSIHIAYFSLDDLERLIKIIKGNVPK